MGRRSSGGWRWRQSQPLFLLLLLALSSIFICLPLRTLAHPCEDTLEDFQHPCKPCPRKNWEHSVSNEPFVYVPPPKPPLPPDPIKCSLKKFFGKEEYCDNVEIVEYDNGTDKEDIGCFNPDPVDTETTFTISDDIANEVELDPHKSAIGFTIPEVPFFRYFLPPQSRNKPSPDYGKFDIGQVAKYYIKPDPPAFDTDFELFEWPGKTDEDNKGYLEDVTKHTYGCVDDQIFDKKCAIPHIYVMLSYQKPISKFLNYPCNSKQGTHIVAYGHAKDYDLDQEKLERSDFKGTPTQRIWLSHGTVSLHKQYIPPLYVRNLTLFEFQDSNSVPGDRCNGFNKDNQLNYTDFRKVLDFSFSTGRLILGMECGILIYERIMARSFLAYPAKLITEDTQSAFFPAPVNLVASSVCCGTVAECASETHMVAAYSKDVFFREPKDIKFLYVSFDLGDTFEKKVIAPQSSMINLIQSMYRLYDLWDFFYKVLEHPDSVKSKYSNDPFIEKVRNDVLKNFKTHPSWETLNPEEKETYIRAEARGDSKNQKWEAGTRILGSIACDRLREFLKTEVASHNSKHPVSPSMLTGGYNPDTDYTPEWVKTSIAQRYKEFFPNNPKQWNHFECEKVPSCIEKFEEDVVVQELLKSYQGAAPDLIANNIARCRTIKALNWVNKTKAYSRKHNHEEIFCTEIASMLIMQQDQSILLLCKVGYCNSIANPNCEKRPPSSVFGFRFAVFKAYLKPKIPIVSPFRRSKRIFQCQPVAQTLLGHIELVDIIDLDMIPVPKSTSLLILNCEKVIFFSPNAGRSIFNVMFYYNDTTANITTFKRSTHLNDLTIAPSATMEPSGHSTLITFSNFYLYGVFNYNREFRLILGKIFEIPPPPSAVADINKATNIAIAWFTNSGEISVSILVIEILRSQPEYKDFYVNRSALRLVPYPLSFYSSVKPFYAENTKAFPEAYEKNWLFTDCNTYDFSLKPTSAALDIGESVKIQIRVTDQNPSLPLGVYTNEEQGIAVDVSLEDRSNAKHSDIIRHDWDVTVKALINHRDKEEALIDAFFGSKYTNLAKHSTNVVVVNFPTIRCHVQPSGSVATEIGCLGKKMVAHEDEFREQCKITFVNNFNYTLEKGQYDPEMARYWIENNPEFVRRDEKGNLRIVYDFTRFGCPIEPYQEDDFAPDLRILDSKANGNSSLGTKYNGSYVLIEIFGANKGYDYTLTVGEAGCESPPQTYESMVREWVIRRRIFNITQGRMQQWLRLVYNTPSKGNLLFDSSGVNEHLNIWNRVNYRSCHKKVVGGKELTEEDNAEKYQIMNNAEVLDSNGDRKPINQIKWSTKKRPKVFMFLAIAVDNDDTFCNYYTVFGVSLPKSEELDDYLSFIVFVCFTLLWIILVVLGYWCRKSYIKKQYIEEARAERLKQAAWTVIYRYEKLLQESENKLLEAEMVEHVKTMDLDELKSGIEHFQKSAKK